MGSFSTDIDLRFDQASALKAYKDFTEKAKVLMKDVEAGVDGAAKKLEKTQQDFARTMISTSTRAGRAVESSIRSLERQAELAGKTRSEQLLVRQEKWIKSLGEDEKAINRVTSAFQKLIKAEDEAAKGGGGHGGGAGILALRGVRDLFEGRTTYGAMDIGRAALMGAGGSGGAGAAGAAGGMLAGISTATLAIGGLAVALGASAAASILAAKSMGEYAQSIHEVQVVTGMTAREVQQFQYAAKVTGADVGVLDRMMRGLTQAVTDTGQQGQRARQTLQGMGVDVLALRRGYIGTMDLLEQVSSALERQPNLWERNEEAIELFKRAGISSIGTLTELNSAMRESAGIQFLSQADLDRARDMHKELALLGTEWDQMVNEIKMAVAHPFYVTIKFIRENTESGLEWDPNTGKLIVDPYTAGAHHYAGALAPLNDRLHQDITAATSDHPPIEYSRTPAFNIDALEERASEARKTYLQAYEDRTKYTQAQVDDLRKIADSTKATVDAARKTEEEQKAIAEALRRARLLDQQRRENPFLLPAQVALNRDLSMAGLTTGEKNKFRQYYSGQISFEQTQQADKFQRQMLDVQRTADREAARAQYVEPVNIRDLGQGGVTRANVERDITAQYQQRMDNAAKTFSDDYKDIKARDIDSRDGIALDQQRRDIVATTGKLRTAEAEAAASKERETVTLTQREREQEREFRETMSKIQLGDQEDAIRHGADLARKSADLRFKGDNPAESIAEEYRIATEESRQLYDLEMERIELQETGHKAEISAAEAIRKLHREDEAAAEDSAFKLAKMQQEQLDKLKGTVEPLYHTLFSDPKKFGQQLRGTVQEAALHPIVSGLSEMTATALHPFVYGADGKSGIAGMLGGLFGGGTHNSLGVKPVNNSIPVWIMNLPATSRMGPLPGIIDSGDTSIYSTGGFMGGGGTVGGGFGGGPVGRFGSQFRQFIQSPGMSSGYIGTPGFTPGPLFGGGGFSGGGGSGTSMDQILGLPTISRNNQMTGMTLGGISRGLSGGPFSGLLKSLKGSFMPESYTGLGGEKIFTGAGSSFGDNLGGVLSSKGAASLYMAAGMPLAMAGITGSRRGTGLGILESGLGGAGIGAGIGTMIMPGVGTAIGAGVGAAVGIGIGTGEMLAGVESPTNEAKRLARSIYHININTSTANQIVSTANQSYGGRVSVAVRSPEVRHMLGLYAAGTGQSNLFPASVNDPHGASLVESGGQLQQQATYQYGQAFTQSSNLPVYGGMGSTTLGSPGGPVNLSLNIGGQDAAKFLQGNVVSPDVISTQYASAMNSSSGRVAQSLMMSEPGSIAS